MHRLRYRRLLWVPVALSAYIMTILAARFPATTERLFARGLSRGLREVLGRLTGFLPFSLAEFVVLFGGISILIWLILQVQKIIISKKSRKEPLLRFFATILAAASVVYTTFVLVCGLNYSRITFAEQSGLTVRPSSVEELQALCAELVAEANTVRAQLQEDADGVMLSGYSNAYHLAAYAPEAYRQVAKAYPILGGYTPRPKPLLFSKVLSYMHLSGIYFPFTFEGNINGDMVAYNLPSTMMHELAHFKGFMREEEANFIAYLACVYSGSDEYRYSGLMMALIHSGNALYSADREIYWEVMEAQSPGVRRDFAANNAYWRQFETPVATAATAVNNAYLQANRQEAGVKSYGQMVDLLLADYRQRHEIEA